MRIESSNGRSCFNTDMERHQFDRLPSTIASSRFCLQQHAGLEPDSWFFSINDGEKCHSIAFHIPLTVWPVFLALHAFFLWDELWSGALVRCIIVEIHQNILLRTRFFFFASICFTCFGGLMLVSLPIFGDVAIYTLITEVRGKFNEVSESWKSASNASNLRREAFTSSTLNVGGQIPTGLNWLLPSPESESVQINHRWSTAGPSWSNMPWEYEVDISIGGMSWRSNQSIRWRE